NVKRFRAGVGAVQPTVDGGYIALGGKLKDGVTIVEVQKLDRQLNSEWVRDLGSVGNSLGLSSIAPSPAGGWIVGGQIILPGQSQHDGWIFRLAPSGHPFGNCRASVPREPDLGNGRRQCEVQLTYPPFPTNRPIATVTRCDPPDVPPGFSPVQQDFDFVCSSLEIATNGVHCTVTTRNNYSGNFYIPSTLAGSALLHVGPNENASTDLFFPLDSPPGTYFIEVTTGPNANITSGPAVVSTQTGPALTSEPAPISWIPYNISRTLLCSGEPELPRWVALGDSYSSGEGAGESNYLAETKIPGQNICHRSDTAYPRVTRELDQIANSFFACSGAKSRNVLGAAQFGEAMCFQQKAPPFLCSTYLSPDDVP